MKIDPLDRKEQLAMMNAFRAWMESQEIHPGHATWIMMTMSGALMAAFADDLEDLDTGLELLNGEMRRAARAAFQDMKLKKR